MRRRDLLASAATFAAVQVISGARITALANGDRRRVRPTDAAWPSAKKWASLKDAVGGNLIEVRSLFGDCSTAPKSAACLDALKNITNPFYIGDQAGGTQVSGWLDAWTPAPSVYAVEARETAHVISAVNFARENNLRLVVKGAGHSYQGTSNAPDSLLIWTRAMNKVTLHDRFVPRGGDGKTDPTPAVTAEAGAVWIDLYHAVTAEAGRYVQGGGCTDVGVAGLIQSGGFGSFSKAFGTAAAGLLEAEIVTADGVARIANAYTNPELFWAIKGGGGGSWGVVTTLTLRTHELPQWFGAAWGTVKAQSDDAFHELITHFLEFYAANLLNPHWGEQVSIEPGNTFKLSMLSQGLDPQQSAQAWAPFFSWVSASPTKYIVSQTFEAHASDARRWWDVEGNPAMVRDARAGSPEYRGWWQGDQEQVGMFLHGFESLWLPASLLHADRLPDFVKALSAASRHKRVQLHFNKGLAGAPAAAITAAKDTATNAMVCDAFALAIIADGEAPTYSGLSAAGVNLDAAHRDSKAIERAAAELLKIVPNAGSYVSESNYFSPAWRQAFWGDNYPRLRAAKAKYDPDGLFFVHHGIGSEEWSDDGFTRR